LRTPSPFKKRKKGEKKGWNTFAILTFEKKRKRGASTLPSALLQTTGFWGEGKEKKK